MAETTWWKYGIIYQVYPRSLQDSDGDGVGDLRGIITRLDYLAGLGVAAIWLSPIYPSPMADFGYDIADYCGIDPLFGTLADFDRLVAAAHARGLKLLLDFVPNHSSDRHPWFIESRASRSNPKRDWYVWHDPHPGGGPPNNWMSNFGGSAWTWDSATSQFYYHAFLRQQPDLNWRNPAVREAMHGAMRFWLERGVDGFRVDVIWHLIKDAQLRDNPPNPVYRPGRDGDIDRYLQVYSADQPEVAEVIAGLRRVVDAYPDRVLIGEIYLPLQRLVAYYGKDNGGVQLPFNFALLGAAWNARTIGALIDAYEAALPPGGWPNWVLGNHDQPRIASRIGAAQARVAAMLLLTLRGTPTLYYGDEIGMEDVPILPDAVRDPAEKNEPGRGRGRDPERTPMQWDASPGAGFTTGKPWLPLAADHGTRNVAAESTDETSMLELYRHLVALRRHSRALSRGRYLAVALHAEVLAYARSEGDERVLVVLNLRGQPQPLELPAWTAGDVVLISTASARAGTPVPPFVLEADEGVIIGPAALWAQGAP